MNLHSLLPFQVFGVLQDSGVYFRGVFKVDPQNTGVVQVTHCHWSAARMATFVACNRAIVTWS